MLVPSDFDHDGTVAAADYDGNKGSGLFVGTSRLRSPFKRNSNGPSPLPSPDEARVYLLYLPTRFRQLPYRFWPLSLNEPLRLGGIPMAAPASGGWPKITD